MKETMQDLFFVWGTGNRAENLNRLYPTLLRDERMIGYIDNDCNKVGKLFFGKKIFSPDVIKNYPNCNIFIGVYEQEAIRSQIEKQFSDYGVKILEKNFFKRFGLIKRYEKYDNAEIKEIIDYLRVNTLDVFNYSFVEKYRLEDINIGKDNGLFYTIYNNKKIYFSKDYDTPQKAKEYFLSLLIEQDIKSPHRYLTDDFFVDPNSVLIDAGAAEGIFSISVVDYCSKIYIFEPDENWCEALRLTFSDYLHKVNIINKCVSNYTDFGTTTIDESIKDDQVDFIKMDIEGEEYFALLGASKLLNKSKKIKCVVCTYHQEYAYYAIKDILEENGFSITHSDGYMWYIEHFNEMRPPVLRRGLIRAEKS